MLDEVDEARKVVEHVADELGSMGIEVIVFHDDTINDAEREPGNYREFSQ